RTECRKALSKRRSSSCSLASRPADQATKQHRRGKTGTERHIRIMPPVRIARKEHRIRTLRPGTPAEPARAPRGSRAARTDKALEQPAHPVVQVYLAALETAV